MANATKLRLQFDALYDLHAQFFPMMYNGEVFLLWGIDKFFACIGFWRIPNWVMALATLFGPYGALLGMCVFRHKQKKREWDFKLWICWSGLFHHFLMREWYLDQLQHNNTDKLVINE